MLDMDEINREIDNLEHSKTTYGNVEKLALLYTVRDHNQIVEKPVIPARYSFADKPSSEFIAAARAVEIGVLIDVLNEHMEGVRALYPKEYAAVMRKLNEPARN